MEQTIRRRAPVTVKRLMDWAGARVFRDGKSLFQDGVVRCVEYEPPFVRGELAYGNRTIRCQFELIEGGMVDNQCPCRDSTERGIICSHVIALGMALVHRQADPERERRAEEERRRAQRLAQIQEQDYIKRITVEDDQSPSAVLYLELGADWKEALVRNRIPLRALIRRDQQGIAGLEQIPTDETLAMTEQDDNLLFVLEDISEGPVRGPLEVTVRDFINLLKLHTGKPLLLAGEQRQRLTVNAVAMTSRLKMELDSESGRLVLNLHTELPFQDSDEPPAYLIAGNEGWMFHAGHFWPLESVLPGPLQLIYQRPVIIEREAVPKFLHTELPLIESHLQVETDITLDLFTMEPAEPQFRLVVRGSPASLAATLYAEYEHVSLVAGKADAQGQFALPDPDDILSYLVRNPAREEQALLRLAVVGFKGKVGDDLSSIVGCREVLNFLGSGIPRVRRMGWKTEMEGRAEPFMESLDFATPVVSVDAPDSAGWFEVGFDYEDGTGQSLLESDIQRALLKGEYYLERNGRTILLDADAIQTARDVFSDCAAREGKQPGTFRMAGIYSAYVQSSLDALDGIDVEAAPEWLKRARRQNRGHAMEPFALRPRLEQTLRPYQKEGVYWLRFLERNSLCGILADEMGLGKTLQTLVWLELLKQKAGDHPRPSLIVCPTSLVENWAEEAQRFVPDLRVLIMSGSDRHENWPKVPESDMVITSYALMRRDVEKYIEIDLACAILDEAQHIKNRSTQNAVAAKKLRADHRLVLTGTPIENSVSDLWSIMDFLMPGYLGGHRSFREHYELPIAGGGPEADAAHAKLRKKLHPFLMRRLKTDVAKDLPPKIERVAYCSLSRDQQMVYKKLLEQSRRRIADMVDQQGFNRSRMEILKTLLRLRQVCCHLDLLKLPDLNSDYPSAKMDLFSELLNEAVDGGHRVLVFSQFTSMLAILRQSLEKNDMRYCYLDGSTKNRLSIVREFNTNRAIPVFLISLKAGGTGLNLTGADMVIHFDPWWNPAVEDQATDRAYRIGQKRTVYSVKLITRDSVEEKVLKMQQRKRSVIDATLVKDEQVMQKLTWEDVQDLLNI